MVSAIDTLFHRCMLLFYCKEKGHLSSKSVLNSLFRYGLRFLRHYNSFCNAGLRPYPLLSPDNGGCFTSDVSKVRSARKVLPRSAEYRRILPCCTFRKVRETPLRKPSPLFQYAPRQYRRALAGIVCGKVS